MFRTTRVIHVSVKGVYERSKTFVRLRRYRKRNDDVFKSKKGSKKTLCILFETKIRPIRWLLFWYARNRRRQEALRRINPSPGAETTDDVDQTFSKRRPCVKLLKRRRRRLCKTRDWLVSQRNRYTMVIRSYDNLERILRDKRALHIRKPSQIDPRQNSTFHPLTIYRCWRFVK